MAVSRPGAPAIEWPGAVPTGRDRALQGRSTVREGDRPAGWRVPRQVGSTPLRAPIAAVGSSCVVMP